ncbi:MAG: hypothetical protein U0401_11525 [Anaerolineae bacterium]
MAKFNFKLLLIFLPLTLTLMACSPLISHSLNKQIREYFYKYQPTTGEQFVEWANQNLTDYSAQQIYTTLHDEGKFEAKLGHPNIVGVLSFATRAWAKQNDFRYDAAHWLALQTEAKRNLREDPGKLQLWPEE